MYLIREISVYLGNDRALTTEAPSFRGISTKSDIKKTAFGASSERSVPFTEMPYFLGVLMF